MSDISIRWYNRDESKWLDFDVSEILSLPVVHALSLFGRNSIPVEAFDNGRYIVSTLGQFNDLKKTGSKVFSFRQLILDNGEYLLRPLRDVGFFGGDR